MQSLNWQERPLCPYQLRNRAADVSGSQTADSSETHRQNSTDPFCPHVFQKCLFIIIYVPQDSPALTETESGSWRHIDSKCHNCINSLKLDNNVWFFLEQNNVHVTENCIRITNHCRCWKMPMLFSQMKKISFEELIEDEI